MPHKLLARTVVLIMLLGMLPAFQPQTTQAQDTATYNLTKYDCAPGYDPGFGDASAAFSNCVTPSAGVSFTLSSGDGSYGGTQQTDGGGYTGWSGIPLGVGFSVSESIPNGYGVPWVYCEVSGDPNNPGDVQPSFFQAPGGNMDVGYTDSSLVTYTQANCTWFNIVPNDGSAQLQPEGQGGGEPSLAVTVTINKYVCDYAYPYQQATLSELMANCQSPQPNVPFTIGGDQSTLASTDSGGVVQFTDLSAGNVTVREEQWASYDAGRVFCSVGPDSQAPATPAESEERGITHGSDDTQSIAVDGVSGGQRVYCLWFDATVTESHLGSVLIYKYLCPDSHDPAADFDTTNNECSTAVPNPAFQLTMEGVISDATGDASGFTSFLNYTPGTYSLKQTQPTGLSPIAVYCFSRSVANGQMEKAIPDAYQIASDGSVQLPLQAGYELICYWFDATSTTTTDPGTGTVHVYKYNCPEGFDWQSGGYDYLLSECTEPGDGVYFEIRSTNYQRGETTDTSGAATWDDVPAGVNTLYEDVPDGYQIGRIFCGVAPLNSGSLPTSWEEQGYQDGTQIDVPSGQYFHCYVFDVPTGYGTVYVAKYNCPATHDWENTSYDYWLSECTEWVPNVTFDLTQGSGTQSSVTNTGGLATWALDSEGEVSIKEYPPGGYVLTQVFCGVIETGGEPDDIVFDPMSANQPTTFDVPEGYDLYCIFFNFPDNYGKVIVTKYICYTLTLPLDSPGIEYGTLANQCTEPGEGFEFNLDPGGSSPDQTTDTSGVAEWTQLEPGTQTLTESVPTGWQSIAAWCTTDPSDDSSWEQYGYQDEVTFNLDVQAGETIYCSWYNFAPRYDSTVEITKYICEEGDINSTNPDYLDYVGACQDLGSDWRFGFHDASVTRGATTGASGKVTFGSNDPGTVTLSEVSEPGYGSLALYCNDGSSVDSWMEVPLLSDTTTVSGSISLPSSANWTCQWFNYHYPEGTNYPITITKYTCERFLVRGWPSRADYEEHCTEWAEGVEFRAYAGMELVDSATTDASGVALLEVPAGSYQIVETPVDGYLTGAVYCSTSATDDPTQAETLPLEIDVSSGYPVTCVWYNAEDIWDMTTMDAGTVLVHKVDCPPGYPADSSVGFEDLLEGCALPAENITFSVIQGGSQIASAATDAQGEVALAGAATGVATIGELPITGWDAPRVFCAAVPVGMGRTLVSYDEMTVTNWGVDYDIPADSWIDCVWFDRMPYAGTETDPIQIIVHKIVCDEGIDEPGDTYAGASTECVTAEEGVEFTVTGGDGVSASGPTDVNGYAEYNGLAAGPVRIYEIPRDGYRTGAVFCSFSSGTTSTEFQPVPFEDEAIETYVAGGYKLECYWFNIVEPDTGHVYVFKYVCPEGSTYTSHEDLETYCTEALEGVPFSLEALAGTDSFTEETASNSLAAFYDVPVDDWRVRETPPSGYAPYLVYCGTSDVAYVPPTTWDPYQIKVEDSSIEIQVTKDTYVMCDWFNIESHQDPQVWIYKYNCPESADWHWDYHQLLSNCTTPAPGVEFGFGPEGEGQSASITDDQGRWLYEDLAPGTWYWEEHFPDGYSGAVVYCQWVDPHGSGEFQKAELDGATLWLELDDDQVVTCYWFDFPDGHAPASPTPPSGSGGSSGGSGGGGTGSKPPPLGSNIPTGPIGGGAPGGNTTQPSDPGAPATLIITKYTCAPGYDIYADESDVAADCDELTEGIEYGLTDLTALAEAEEDENVLPAIEVTGDDGKATWTDLAAGPYLLVETMPEGTKEAFIWTCESDAREFQMQYPLTPFSYAGPDGQVGITLIPGETLECDWFDVPVAPGTITLLKFECPGSPVIIAQCDAAGAGVAFSLAPAGVMGPIVELATDETGTATGELPEGSYSITEQNGTPCLIDSESIDENGNIEIAGGAEVEVRLYNCGGS